MAELKVDFSSCQASQVSTWTSKDLVWTIARESYASYRSQRMESNGRAASDIHLPSNFPGSFIQSSLTELVGFTDFTFYCQERRKSFDLGKQNSSQVSRKRSLDSTWRPQYTVIPQVVKLGFVGLTMQSKLCHSILRILTPTTPPLYR